MTAMLIIWGYGIATVDAVREAESDLSLATTDCAEWIASVGEDASVTAVGGPWVVAVECSDGLEESLDLDPAVVGYAVMASQGDDPWFVWSFARNADGKGVESASGTPKMLCVGRAVSKDAALEMAVRLRADQVQHGIDGEVENCGPHSL